MECQSSIDWGLIKGVNCGCWLWVSIYTRQWMPLVHLIPPHSNLGYLENCLGFFLSHGDWLIKGMEILQKRTQVLKGGHSKKPSKHLAFQLTKVSASEVLLSWRNLSRKKWLQRPKFWTVLARQAMFYLTSYRTTQNWQEERNLQLTWHPSQDQQK